MEVWKKIEGFENYEVSNYGNVKSLERIVIIRNNIKIVLKEKKLKNYKTKKGYLETSLRKNNKPNVKKIHRLVYEAFVCKIPLNYCINHIDLDKKNNHISNLELVTNAENICHAELNNKKNTSKFIGVSFCKDRNKWISQIVFNKKHYFLGRFNSQEEARNARTNFEKENNINNKYSICQTFKVN
jgi:hypothetical protein